MVAICPDRIPWRVQISLTAAKRSSPGAILPRTVAEMVPGAEETLSADTFVSPSYIIPRTAAAILSGVMR